MPANQVHFKPAFFTFLRELNANNNRAWFTENKARYQSDVQQPMLTFIGDLAERMRKSHPDFIFDPRPQGGSMFRIYRDTRFSKDKTPYKVAAAAHFPHRTRTGNTGIPGFYLHLEPGDCLGGGGIYHPDAKSLGLIRDRIVAKPKEWAAVLQKVRPITGDTLIRPPAGYDAGHKYIEDLKRKDHYHMTSFSEREVTSRRFLDLYVETIKRTQPLVGFLLKALGLSK